MAIDEGKKDEQVSEGKWIGYGANPCQRGNALKTRSGHCPQCKTESIGYLKRHNV